MTRYTDLEVSKLSKQEAESVIERLHMGFKQAILSGDWDTAKQCHDEIAQICNVAL